jgi:hypothetical protein
MRVRTNKIKKLKKKNEWVQAKEEFTVQGQRDII